MACSTHLLNSIPANNSIRMSKVCESWSLEDLCDMSEQDMNLLLAYYKPDQVPSLNELRGEPDPSHYEFEGSFGWF